MTNDDLWNVAPGLEPAADRAGLEALPTPVQRYFRHTILARPPLASRARLVMRGEIKLQRWFPFRAEQVVHRDRGFIWAAQVRMGGMPVRGSDRFLDGRGALSWRMLGIVPVMRAGGPDVDRSALGRFRIESIWLPSILLRWQWAAPSSGVIEGLAPGAGPDDRLTLTIDSDGRPRTVAMMRWGNPDGGPFRSIPFGALFEEERTFQGYTIPSRVRVGWQFDTDRFASEGEFFRATIEEAEFR